jgi:hypothetical protein
MVCPKCLNIHHGELCLYKYLKYIKEMKKILKDNCIPDPMRVTRQLNESKIKFSQQAIDKMEEEKRKNMLQKWNKMQITSEYQYSFKATKATPVEKYQFKVKMLAAQIENLNNQFQENIVKLVERKYKVGWFQKEEDVRTKLEQENYSIKVKKDELEQELEDMEKVGVLPSGRIRLFIEDPYFYDYSRNAAINLYRYEIFQYIKNQKIMLSLKRAAKKWFITDKYLIQNQSRLDILNKRIKEENQALVTVMNKKSEIYQSYKKVLTERYLKKKERNYMKLRNMMDGIRATYQIKRDTLYQDYMERKNRLYKYLPQPKRKILFSD